MNTETFNFSWSIGPSRPDDGTRLIARPFDSYPLDGDYWVLALGSKTPVRFTRADVEVLALCNAFRTAAGHADAVARRHRGWAANRAGLVPAIERLRAAGLLASAAEIASELAAVEEPAASPLATLFIRTCERPDALRRVLESLSSAAPAGLDRVVVVDDSRSDDVIAANERLASSANGSAPFEIRHVDRAARRRLAASLAGDATARSALETHLTGDALALGPSHGAAVNTALLLGAGARIALLDDDATLTGHRPPQAGPDDIRFAPAPQRRITVADSDSTLRTQCASLDDDPLALHADALGRPLGSLLGDQPDGREGSLLGDIDPASLARLAPGSRVRATFNGTLGDPGSVNRLGLLCGHADDIARLAAQDGDFEARVRHGRTALYVPNPRVSIDAAAMTTTLTGVDDRELLPPTLPAGRGEDLVLATTMAFAHPGCLFMDLPFLLAHRPDEPARPERGEAAVARRPGLSMVVCRIVESLHDAAPSAGPEARLRRLAAAMGELADARPDHARSLIAREMVDTRASIISALESNLRTLPDPDPARRLLRRAIEAQLQFGEDDDAHVDAVIEPLRRYARFSAEALDPWSHAWRTAADASLDELLADAAPAESGGRP